MDHIRKLLLVNLQQGDGLFQRLKHGICGVLSFLHSQQVTHDPNQATVVALLHPLAQASLSHTDKLVQI